MLCISSRCIITRVWVCDSCAVGCLSMLVMKREEIGAEKTVSDHCSDRESFRNRKLVCERCRKNAFNLVVVFVRSLPR